MTKVLMEGSHAIAEAAIQAGCRFYAGYPITPSTEILEYMSHRLPQVGGVCMNAESELEAINMVWGAAGCGVRAMIASTGQGISLETATALGALPAMLWAHRQHLIHVFFGVLHRYVQPRSSAHLTMAGVKDAQKIWMRQGDQFPPASDLLGCVRAVGPNQLNGGRLS